MIEVNENNIDALLAKGLVLVEFGAEWCGPCKTLLPILDRFAGQAGERLSIVSVDIDQSPSVAARHGVMSVPTMVLFQDGKVVERVVGMISEGNLRKKLQPYVGAL
ncbi:MAG: thioredoxin family protein [Acidobacteriota bacterium]